MLQLRPLVLFYLFIQAISVSTINTMCCRRPCSVRVQPQSQTRNSRSKKMLNDRLSSAVECGTMASAAVVVGGATGLLMTNPDAPILGQIAAGFLGAAAGLWGTYVACRFVGERSDAYLEQWREYSGMPIRSMVSLESRRLKRSKSAEPELTRRTRLAGSNVRRAPAILIHDGEHNWRASRSGRTVDVGPVSAYDRK